jgi:hypothetical protein
MEEDTSQHFTGLIITRLREKRMTQSELDRVRRLPTHSPHTGSAKKRNTVSPRAAATARLTRSAQ